MYRLLLRGLHGYPLLYAICRWLSSRKGLVLGVDDVTPVQVAPVQTQHQLEQCRKKRMIRARAVNGQMMYDTYELLALTELFYRRKLRKTLSRIPQFTVR